MRIFTAVSSEGLDTPAQWHHDSEQFGVTNMLDGVGLLRRASQGADHGVSHKMHWLHPKIVCFQLLVRPELGLCF